VEGQTRSWGAELVSCICSDLFSNLGDLVKPGCSDLFD